MTIDRAIEILDPEHREHYESIEPVNEACRMGMEALLFYKRVVHCRDCKFYRGHGLCAEDCGPAFYIDDDWFCASGERRSEDGNETDVGKRT